MPVPGQKPVVPDPPKLKKTVRLGINILDAPNINPAVRAKLLNGKVDLDKDKIVEMGPEDRILVFTCDPVLAALTIDLIRNENRADGSETCRAYIQVGDSAWKRFPEYAVLTLLEDGNATLNPDHFPVEIELAEFVPVKPQPVALGRRRKSSG